MTHALFKQIDLTAKLGQDGSSLQALNALRVIRETVAKHLVGAEAAEEHPLERAVLALRTIAEYPCPEQDDLPAANMRQIALAALSGAGASSEPGNPGGEPVSGPGNAGERPHPAPGSGDSKLAESLQTLVRWLDRAEIEDGYVGVPVIEAVEVVVNELRRLQAEVADWQEAAGRSRSDVVAYIAERAKLLEERDSQQRLAIKAMEEVAALRSELQTQRERNTELIFKLGSATNGWGRCEKERDAALARVAEYEAQGQHSVPGNAAALVRAEAKKYSLNAAGMLDSGAPEHAQTFAIVQLLSEFDDEEAESHWEAIMAYSDFRTSDALFRAAELLAAAPGTEVPQAWLDVQAERRRQITAEGWTPDHDDLYCAAELPRAAAAYILSGANDEAPAIWPFVAKWWKPRDARANYVRAGALILAEIERLDRAAASQGGVGDA
ncbi:hypothetical protein QSQ13_16645 [Pseudomonas aeruginosa]|uniref:hypothetical protein n=1 Tax=Pseudomonas aeruginosa TaxID=287 RepID=UPI0018A2A2FD|nr:hypothetical protein [Pseudomonas aeruginosa]MDN5260004.1 hypothetical protein [Pseudomonas aeruginosa]